MAERDPILRFSAWLREQRVATQAALDGIHHITGITDDLERADTFYQDALGRRYVSWPGSPFADPFGSQFLEESRLTNFCMRAKGWELEPLEKK